MKRKTNVIWPDWPAPNSVKAFTTTRVGGVSESPYGSFNLGAHVGDELESVTENRHLLHTELNVPNTITWLNQTHSTNVAVLPENVPKEADAAFTNHPMQVCAVLTADCLPVVFTNISGTQVAVAHAGWRGLCNGVLERTLANFDSPKEVIAWLGPAIGPEAFEVGAEVKAAFEAKMPTAEAAFLPSVNEGKWMGDLYLLAKQRLQSEGISQIYGGHCCTYSESDTFYSYRREQHTGRMATVIWIDQQS